jgi:hypothetical protein
MKIATTCAVLLLGVPLLAQEPRERTTGSGVSATETRSVTGFDKVDLQGTASVEIVVGQTFDVRVTADDNILPLITTTVDEETLVIGMKDATSISPKVKMTVEIQMPKLGQLRLSGAGSFAVSELRDEPLKVELAGAGSITAEGQVEGLSIDVAGAGDVDVSKLDVPEADVTIAGVGNVNVSAEKSLRVSITGVGEVRYAGSPEVTKKIEGVGNVRKDAREGKSS